MESLSNRQEKPTIDILPPMSRRCMAIVRGLHLLFLLIPLLLGLWIGEAFGWLYGLFAWMGAVFAAMIVLSKLKLAFIPFEQHEVPHSTAAILRWTVYRKFC